MSANLELVKQLGVSDENVRRINVIHSELISIITEADDYLKIVDRAQLIAHVQDLEYALQRLWGFIEDRRFHTWNKRLEKRLREVDETNVNIEAVK